MADNAFHYRFWISDKYGLIRRRARPGELYHPEIWRDGRWKAGSAYVMDAITGMGEDAFSCGESADEITLEKAMDYAANNGIDLYAVNPEEAEESGKVKAKQ